MRKINGGLALLVIVSLALIGPVSLIVVQGESSPTSTITITQSASTSIILNETSTSITTSTTSRTLTQGTRLTWTSITMTETSTQATMSSTTITQPLSTVTSTTTEPLLVLTSYLGLLLVGLVAAFAFGSVVYGRLQSLKRGVTCKDCGYQNPPFAGLYCTNCGKTLRKRS